MEKLLAIGKALIDMIPSSTGRIMDVEGPRPKVGKAPLSICGAYTALGGESAMIIVLGKDTFDERVVKEIQRFRTYTEYIRQTNVTNTFLTLIALGEHTNREFLLHRNIGANMLLSKKDIRESWFEDRYGSYFCLVSSDGFPMEKAHNQALEPAKRKNLLVSSGPNARLPLFDDHEYLRKAIHEYIHSADTLKISDEEVSFVFGSDHIEERVQYILDPSVRLLVYAAEKDGAVAYTRYNMAYADDVEIKAVGTTGVGGGFIGCLPHHLFKNDIHASDLDRLNEHQSRNYLDMCSKFYSIFITREGTIASYPSR